ncbi:MAG: sulfotransferase family protein [Candidatus Brocadiia bacterium]
MSKKPTPIFVLGKHRSGTTWVREILGNHPDVASVGAESAFFSHVIPKFGPIETANDFIAFAEAFGASYFFALSGQEKSDLYRYGPLPLRTFFQRFMDDVARKENCQFWLDKTPDHTLHINRLLHIYKDARFVGITRDPAEVARSSLKMFHNKKHLPSVRKRKLFLLRTVFLRQAYNKYLERARNQSSRVFRVHYEDLLNDTSSTVKGMCDFLNISYHPDMLDTGDANTSFSSERERKQTLSNNEVNWVTSVNSVLRYLPTAFFDAILAANALRRRLSPRPLPHWFYKSKKQELGWD